MQYKIKYIKNIAIFLSIAMFFFACDSKQVDALGEKKVNFPDKSLINAHIIYKDSGKVVLDLKSPLIEEYSMIDTPYTIFPKGLNLKYYQKKVDSPGYMRADWAKYSNKTNLYEGRGNVLIISEKGDTIKSQKLFWNQKTKLITTTDTVYIITVLGDSLQANNGLEAKDDLTKYKLYNNSGSKKIKEKF